MKRNTRATAVTQGTAAPNFGLPDQKGERHTLFEYRSEWVLLYFFPRKEMERCTETSCPIRDHFVKFKTRRVYVLGVTTAAPEELWDFARRYEFPYRLLSDREKKVLRLYGAVLSVPMPGRKPAAEARQICFLISPQGTVEKIYDDPDAEKQADDIFADLMKIPETVNRRIAPEDMRIPGQPERRFTLE